MPVGALPLGHGARGSQGGRERWVPVDPIACPLWSFVGLSAELNHGAHNRRGRTHQKAMQLGLPLGLSCYLVWFVVY
jgi:hypothetical protein